MGARLVVNMYCICDAGHCEASQTPDVLYNCHNFAADKHRMKLDEHKYVRKIFRLRLQLMFAHEYCCRYRYLILTLKTMKNLLKVVTGVFAVLLLVGLGVLLIW